MSNNAPFVSEIERVRAKSDITADFYAQALEASKQFRKEYPERMNVVKAHEMPMERTASVEDMVGNLWRLGRTPSQAEFEQFFSNIAQVGSQQNLAAQAAAAQAAQAAQPETNGTDATGIPRVASIDLLRKMIMQGQQPPVAPAMVPNLMNPMAGMGAMQTGLGGAGEHPTATSNPRFPALGVTPVFG